MTSLRSFPIRRGGVAALAAAAVLAACSGSAATGGVGLIEGDLADEIGLGDLEATCDEPAEKAEGETFECTATTTDDRTITFLGTMESDDEFEIVTTNLLTVTDVTAIRTEAARALSAQIGVEISPDDIDCGDQSVIIADDEFVCAITDTSTGDVFDLTITTAPFVPGVGIAPTYFEIGPEPR